MQGCTIPYHVVAIANEFKLLNPTGHYVYHKFNIQQLYALPTLYLCVLYLSENKERLVLLTAQTNWFYSRDEKCLLRSMDWGFKAQCH